MSSTETAVTVPALRRMRPGDLPEVLAIERASYSEGWPTTAFERELTQNQMARYIVLARGATESAAGQILGFAGLWLMVDQAHIVTVAVVPAERGRGFGRLLVHGLVGMGRDQGMESATLEVRTSNTAARGLYGAYGFYEVGTRKKYYSDNGEDAVIMTTEKLRSPAYEARLERLGARLGELLPGVSVEVGD